MSCTCRSTSYRQCILLQVILLERATRNILPGYIPQLIFSGILICNSNTIGGPLNTVPNTISFRLHLT
uniref:Uncharacterized protein n=1 Tax=Arundo donax TaxID=35708 RepID=A0A0A9EMI7_ARUDO